VATPQQIARLAAGAKGGTAGVAEFDQAAKQIRSSRDQAIGQMGHAASALMAPGALTAQLQGNLRTSAQGALSDLGEYSGAAANADAQDQAGTANYLNEANAAIPLINSYSNLDLQQKLEMLAAQRARSTRAGGGAKPLSDAQLRTDLIGLAQLKRDQAAANQQQSYKADLAHLDAVAQGGPAGAAALAPDQILNTAPAIGAFGPQGVQGPPGTVYPNAPGQGHGFLTALPSNVLNQPPPQTGSPAPPKLINGPATIANNFQGELDQQALARQSAVQKIMNDLHGPGITQEAINQGLQIPGVDPNRLYGLLTPQVDASYVRAQEARGLYKDPNRITSTDQVTPPEVAARSIGMDPKQFQGAFAAKYFDWNGDSKLKAGFAKWQAVNAGEAQKDPAVQRADFEADPNNQGFAKNVVEDLINQAPTLIRRGWSFPLFAAEWKNDPAYNANKASIELALKMVQPLFNAAAAQRTRTTSVSAGQALQGG
jgi:hypothetical protein